MFCNEFTSYVFTEFKRNSNMKIKNINNIENGTKYLEFSLIFGKLFEKKNLNF